MALYFRNPQGGEAEILAPIGLILVLLVVILRLLLGYSRERIIVSDDKVTWYDWMGKVKLQVDRTQIARQPDKKFWTLRFGTVFPTPQGVLRFIEGASRL